MSLRDDQLLAAEIKELLADDFDLALTGIEDGELDQLLRDTGEGGDRDGRRPTIIIPEAPQNPVSRTGDLWLLGDHRLLCGDSTSHEDVRRLMRGEPASGAAAAFCPSVGRSVASRPPAAGDGTSRPAGTCCAGRPRS